MQRDSNITLIISPIQVFADRKFIVEELDSINKEKLFIELIRDTPEIKKSGLIFLSGDVHFAQFFHSSCKSLATGYDIIEAASSGLTHHSQIGGLGEPMLRIFTAPFWMESKRFIDLNYGMTRVRKQGDDVEVIIEIRDINNKVILEKILSLNKDLTYNKEGLRYG